MMIGSWVTVSLLGAALRLFNNEQSGNAISRDTLLTLIKQIP